MSEWRKTAALVAAIVVFAMLVFGLRMFNWMPFVASGLTWLFVMLGTAPVPVKKGPGGAKDRAGRKAEDQAIAELGQAARRLKRLATRAPEKDRPLFQKMADMVQTIREHHIARPAHVTLTAKFRRHVLGRIVQSVADYVDLARRSGPEQRGRLDQISDQLANFVPALEKIDKACLENDLTELEIHVDVLGDQLDRSRR